MKRNSSIYIIRNDSHCIYGTMVERILSTKHRETVEHSRKRLQNDSSIFAQKERGARYRGIPAPKQFDRLRDDLYKSVNKMLDRLLHQTYTQAKGTKIDDVRRFGSRGRAKHGNGKGQTQYEQMNKGSKFNFDPDTCPYILNFVLQNATPLVKLEPILTDNGPMFPAHSSQIQVNTT